jgi:hypothetical protein
VHKLTKLVGDLILFGGCILLAYGIFTILGFSYTIEAVSNLFGTKELNQPFQLLNIILGFSEILGSLIIMGFGSIVYCVAQIAENTIPKEKA